jgi:mRNA-degrading endonuclease toxin of MazEF toxin-antitoxin module
VKRGDLVIVDFRNVNPPAGVRPSLVVQNDRDNVRATKTIVVQVTTNLRRAGLDTHFLIDANHPDWTASGLRRPSVVNCSILATIEQADVVGVIGSLSTQTMKDIEARLKAALAII